MGDLDLKKLLLGSTMLIGMTAFSTVSAHAQDDEVVEIEEQDEVASTGPQDVITITGSRIRRTEVDSTTPVFTFGEAQLEDRGFTNIADALNESPIFGGSQTPLGDQGGFTAGQNQVNLFDLGTQRTLTLVNGRRLVSSNSAAIGGGQVDLNTIPIALVERIETVPLTGAAIYGADAIAGTVNIILKDDFEGFETTAQFGENGNSVARSYQISTVAGTNFADNRGNLTFAAEFTQDSGLLQCEIDYLCNNNPGVDNSRNTLIDRDGDGMFEDRNGDGIIQASADPLLDDRFPVQLVYRDLKLALFDEYGSVTPAGGGYLPPLGLGSLADGNFYRFTRDGKLETCEQGPTQQRNILTRGGDEVCGYDFFDNVTQIRSPVERFNVFSALTYDISDTITYRQDFLYANTRGEELVNQGGFQTAFFPGTSAAITVDVDNPFLDPQARDILVSNGITDQFSIHRFNNDIIGQGANNNETHVWRFSSILEGEFEALDRNFYWDVSGVFGRADIQVQNQGIVDGRFLNAVDARRVDDELLGQIQDQDPDDDTDDLDSLDAALEALRGSNSGFTANINRGDIICGAYADLAAGTLTGFNSRASGSGLVDEDIPFLDGCVPLNLFGSQASGEALAFINGGPQISASQNEQTVLAANIGGELISLPAGELAFNVGVETRREESEFVPGLGLTVPITRSSVSEPISGRSTTEEIYGEVVVPVISPDMNIPFAQSLEFTGAARWQRFNTTAPDGDRNSTQAQVYQATGKFTPIDDISLRATYATAFRNPSFFELFQPESQSFILGADPCDSRSVVLGPNPSVRRANCESIGIDTNTFRSNIQDGTISGGISSGNPNLTPEENESYSFGVVLQPRWIEGLDIAVDYYNLEIQDQINQVTFAVLAATCFDSSAFPNEPACDTFVRDPDTYQVIEARDTVANVAVSTFEAVTARVFYDFDVAEALSLFKLSDGSGDLGQITLDAFTQHNISNEFQATAASDVTEDVGDFGDPEWLGTFDTSYELGKWRVTHRLQWQNDVLVDALERQFYANEFEAVTYGTQSGFLADIKNESDARFIHDLGVRYAVTESVTAQFNVLNLTDRKPNEFQQAVGHFGIDERLGRRYTARLNVEF